MIKYTHGYRLRIIPFSPARGFGLLVPYSIAHTHTLAAPHYRNIGYFRSLLTVFVAVVVTATRQFIQWQAEGALDRRILLYT